MALPAAMILSGVPQEQFTGDLGVVFNQGTLLLKTPEASPPTSPRSTSPSESGISSLSTISSISSLSTVSTDTERSLSLDYYLDVIDHLEQRFLVRTPKKLLDFPHPLSYRTLDTKIMYGNRNLIDLNSNVKTGSWTLQPAILQNGVKNFFQNRSQMSRLDGAHIPPHEMRICKSWDCGYKEPMYL